MNKLQIQCITDKVSQRIVLIGTQTCTYYRSKIADDWQRNEQFPDYMYLISELIFCRYQFLFYIQRKQYLNALQR